MFDVDDGQGDSCVLYSDLDQIRNTDAVDRRHHRMVRAEQRWLYQYCLHEIAEDVPCTTLPLRCRHEFSEHVETCSLAFLERQAPTRTLLLGDVVQRCTLLLQPGEDVRFIDLPLLSTQCTGGTINQGAFGRLLCERQEVKAE